jgi:hypothetical protein
LYNGYKVVLNDYHGSSPYVHYREHKAKYYKGYHNEHQENYRTAQNYRPHNNVNHNDNQSHNDNQNHDNHHGNGNNGHGKGKH